MKLPQFPQLDVNAILVTPWHPFRVQGFAYSFSQGYTLGYRILPRWGTGNVAEVLPGQVILLGYPILPRLGGSGRRLVVDKVISLGLESGPRAHWTADLKYKPRVAPVGHRAIGQRIGVVSMSTKTVQVAPTGHNAIAQGNALGSCSRDSRQP